MKLRLVLSGLVLATSLAFSASASAITLITIPDPTAPSGVVPKLSFRLTGTSPGHTYDLGWLLVGSRGRAHCSQLGEALGGSSTTSTVTLGPAPDGDYSDPTVYWFCARRTYRANIDELGPHFSSRRVATLTFRAPGVSGPGPVARLTPSALSFADQPGGVAPAQTETLTNAGGGSLHVSELVLGGTDPGAFGVLSDGCAGRTLRAGASCRTTVRFAPLFTGSVAAELQYGDDAPGNPQPVELNGTAAGPPVGGSAVQGSVLLGPAAGPAAGAQVQLCPADHANDYACQTQATDSLGRYGFVRLGPGPYTVQAYPPSHSGLIAVSNMVSLAAATGVTDDLVLRRGVALSAGLSVLGPAGLITRGVPSVNWLNPFTLSVPLGPVPQAPPNSRRLFGAILELSSGTGLNSADVALFEVRYGADGRPSYVSQLVEGPGQVLSGGAAARALRSARREPRVGEVTPCVASANTFAFQASPAGGVQFTLGVPGGGPPVVVHFDPIALPSPQPTGNRGLDVAANGLVALANATIDTIPGVGEYNEAIYGLNVAANVANGQYGAALEGAVFNFGIPALGEHNGIPNTPFHGTASFATWEFSSGVSQAAIDSTLTPDPSSSDPCGIGQLGSDLYVDPSGRVLTSTGAPVAGARVTLSRAATRHGAAHRVPSGNAAMSPANRRNPDFTDALGSFGWDVIAGFYRVSASHPGCHSASGGSSASSPLLVVPPPAANLVLRLRCPHLRLAGSRTTLARTRPALHTRTGVGHATVLAARVSARRGHGRPRGTVTFSAGRRTLGVLPLDARGQATLTLARVPSGRISASYSGDGRYSPSRARAG